MGRARQGKGWDRVVAVLSRYGHLRGMVEAGFFKDATKAGC